MSDLEKELAALPGPEAPPWLEARTLRYVREKLREKEEARSNHRALAFVVAFCWIFSLATWPVIHVANGAGACRWLVLSTLFAWLTAGLAAVILSYRRRKHESFS